MAEYIEREALKQYLLSKGFYPAIVKGALESLPTADVVEVVRCEDCRHAIVNENNQNKPLICCLTKMCGVTYPHWYCADGERKVSE